MKITMNRGRGELTGQGASVATLAEILSQRLGRTVLDKTGLAGNYDFTLQWPTDQGLIPGFKSTQARPQGTDPSESSEPAIFKAIQEQLGLELKSQSAAMPLVVIDYVEMPAEN
jgi:bla regulator protein BlaR1